MLFFEVFRGYFKRLLKFMIRMLPEKVDAPDQGFDNQAGVKARGDQPLAPQGFAAG